MKYVVIDYRRLISNYDLLFWLLIAVCVPLIAQSFPMMYLRYDIWDHVYRIREMVLDATTISPAKRYWYACWAFVFKLFEVDSIFSMAIVIHRVQFVANCLIIYIAVKQLFEPLLSLSRYNKRQNQWLSSLALSGVLIWLVTIGTFSFIQQAWIMWYSVNYQITLSFLLLSISLIVNLLTVEQSKNVQIIKTIVAAALLVLILLFHAGELAYFIFYLPIFFVCFFNKLRFDGKYLVGGVILVMLALYFGIKFYTDQIPMLLTLIKNNDWLKMIILINEKGAWNVTDGGNRYAGNWNEMYRLSVYTLLGVAGLTFLNLVKINKKVLSFIVLSLVFCFAPSYIFSAGFLSLVSYDGIVNRYYFASFLFIALPLCAYLTLDKYKIFYHPINVVVITVVVIAAIYTYSKYYNNQGVFYNNVKSITTSIKAKKLDIEVSALEVAGVEKQIQIAESNANPSNFIYCGPYKKIHMIAYFFNRKNVHFDRLKDISIYECEENAKKLNKYVVHIE
jgi:hypothetical protein